MSNEKGAPVGWPINVATLVGNDVGALAGVICEEAERAVVKVGGGGDFFFAAPLTDVGDFVGELQDRHVDILQIVSHAGESGGMSLSDVWGSFDVEAANFAAAVAHNRIKLAVVTTCFGGQIADALVTGGAVEVAIGLDMPQTFAVARAFCQAFYRSLARGNTIRRAFSDGKGQAALRGGTDIDKFRLVPDGDVADVPMLVQPAFVFVSAPSEASKSAVTALAKAVSPLPTFHVDDIEAGQTVGDVVAGRIAAAKVIAVIFEGDDIRDADALEQVASAVPKARSGAVRLFPLYLKGTTPNPRVPYGLRRLQPLYLEDSRYGGDYTRVGEDLKKLAG